MKEEAWNFLGFFGLNFFFILVKHLDLQINVNWIVDKDRSMVEDSICLHFWCESPDARYRLLYPGTSNISPDKSLPIHNPPITGLHLCNSSIMLIMGPKDFSPPPPSNLWLFRPFKYTIAIVTFFFLLQWEYLFTN